MKIFLTGGTGFVGSHLADFFLKEGAQVFALVRDLQRKKWLEGKNVQCLKGNLFSLPELPKDIDFVFHIAGSTKSLKVADYYTVNQQGTASLLQALQNQGIKPQRIILLSSLAASGPTCRGGMIRENMAPRPVTIYGKSKLLGEFEALKYRNSFPLTIIRVGGVYGPRDKDFLPFFKIIKAGILPRIGTQKRMVNLCHVLDLAKGMALAARKETVSGEIFNIADPNPVSWEDIGKAAARALKRKTVPIHLPLAALGIAAGFTELSGRIRRKPCNLDRQKFREICQASWVADTTRARNILNFRPDRTFQAGIQQTVDWYRAQGWL